MRKNLLFFLLSLLVITVTQAQDRTVSGTVTSADDGSALPGVNVILKGTTTGGVTDLNGNYTVSIPQDGGTLVFSFIGFQSQEVAVGTRSTVDVQLSTDVTQLSEVVVTGYGTQEKRSISGSIASVKGEAIENIPLQSFDRALQGRAAGVQVVAASGAPGGGVNVRIRGVGSINAGSEPLYIVDGIQMRSGDQNTFGSGNTLNGINPNDIESIEVLKDAASAAIYGAQAANGVVLITTKKGKASQKTEVNFSAQYGQTTPIKLIPTMNAAELSLIRQEAAVNRANTLGNDPDAARQAIINRYGSSDPNDPNYTTTDWQDAAYRTGVNQIYDLNIRGGDSKTSFFVSGSYNLQEGHVIGSDFERGTLRANFDHKFNDKLSLEQRLGFSTNTQSGTISDGAFINSPFFASLFIEPWQPIYDENGDYNNPLTPPFDYNIVEMVDKNLRVSNTIQTIGSLALNYQIIPDLRLRVFGGLDHSDFAEYNYRDPSLPRNASFNGSRNHRDRRITNWNTNATLSYSKVLADKHAISAILGGEYKAEKWNTITTTAEGFPNSFLKTLASAANPTAATSFDTEWKVSSLFFQGNYTFSDKYIFGASYRRDGSSRFGEDNRWGNFGSLSVAWRISEEGFMQNVGFIDDLKLRASAGVRGNADIGDFAWQAAWGAGGDYLNRISTRKTVLGNDQLTWERARDINIGLDFAFVNGRISGSLDLYKRVNDDLLLNVTLPTDTGWGSILANEGEVQNQGAEIEITTVNVIKGGFRWSTSFNYSYNKSRVNAVVEGEDFIEANGYRWIVGEEMRTNWYPTYAGVNPANGRPMWLDSLNNLTYVLQGRDSRVQGSQLPKHYGGLNNTVSYKGVTLDFLFQFQYGNVVLNNSAFFHENSGAYSWNQAASQLNRWQQPGDITEVPRPYDGGAEPNTTRGNQFSSRQLEDASYIRLKQIRLSYDFPKSLLGNSIRNLSVFGQGQNLWTYTEYTGLDPEIVTFDIGRYPQGKIWTVGLNIGL